MPADIIPLGARLRQRRTERGLSQAQAARELEVARTAYRLWEMEAARPSPDRWRQIASWLGVSVTAMLLAAELIGEQEALDAERIAAEAGLAGQRWDEASDVDEGDFFSQERDLIADRVRLGAISSEQATGLRHVLAHLQSAVPDDASDGWHPGQFRKRLPCAPLAPALARAAVATTAVGIPARAIADASLLTSELVTNSVTHSHSDWVDIDIDLTADRLRVAVSDQDTQTIRPRTPGPDGGWGLGLIAALATRWGVEQRPGGKAVWIELDLQPTCDPR